MFEDDVLLRCQQRWLLGMSRTLTTNKEGVTNVVEWRDVMDFAMLCFWEEVRGMVCWICGC